MTAEPMTTEDLDTIRGAIARSDLIDEESLPLAFSDRKRLLAEVDRLRAENARLAAQGRVSGPETTGGHPSEGPAPTGLPGAAQGTAPLTLAQAATALHDWAGDLADGTRTDWPAGHPGIIRGIRAAADWLDARDKYETETREQLRALVNRHGMADRTCLISDNTTE